MLTNQQQQDPQSEELNFTAFTDLCRFCSLRLGAKINLFDKEAEHRQLLFKVRTFLPTAVQLFSHYNNQPNLFSTIRCCLISDIQGRLSSEKDMWTVCYKDWSNIRMEKHMHSNRHSASKLCWIYESGYGHHKFSGMSRLDIQSNLTKFSFGMWRQSLSDWENYIRKGMSISRSHFIVR